MSARIHFRCLALALAFAPSVLDAADIVNRRSGAQREGGTISKMSKTEVTVTKQVGGDVTIPANDVASIEWDGAPPGLGLGSAAVAAGNLDYAQQQLDQARTEAAGSDKPGLKGDIDFYLAKVFALRAMTDPAQVAEARNRLDAFLKANRDHYRAYDAQLLLGDVARAGKDFPAAIAAYTAVSVAPWKDFQMAAQLGNARTMLAQDNVDGAKREFDAVAAVNPQDAAQKSRRLEALLGQARCLQLKQQYAEAVKILEQLIDGTTASEARLQAEAYLRQGDCFVAMGADPKEAIMAYLHVDVIPAMSRESDLHAEALYNLARLWNQVGHPERAGEAADALRGEYPESEWTKKLGG
jgi:tetratricopeptide (TPR) repeat protein